MEKRGTSLNVVKTIANCDVFEEAFFLELVELANLQLVWTCGSHPWLRRMSKLGPRFAFVVVAGPGRQLWSGVYGRQFSC